VVELEVGTPSSQYETVKSYGSELLDLCAPRPNDGPHERLRDKDLHLLIRAVTQTTVLERGREREDEIFS
jgi:hypothetical protein